MDTKPPAMDAKPPAKGRIVRRLLYDLISAAPSIRRGLLFY